MVYTRLMVYISPIKNKITTESNYLKYLKFRNFDLILCASCPVIDKLGLWGHVGKATKHGNAIIVYM